MTPILVRPVREQLEHDRVIRLLQQRWRRKYLVAINQGSETTAAVVLGDSTLYPDVVLAPLGKPNKPEIVVEVETGESVNHLEAMAEWARLARLKAAFHLYLPAGSMERARRLCTDYNIEVDEILDLPPRGGPDALHISVQGAASPPGDPESRHREEAGAARIREEPPARTEACRAEGGVCPPGRQAA